MKNIFRDLRNILILLILIFSFLIAPKDTNTITDEDYSISTFSNDSPYTSIETN